MNLEIGAPLTVDIIGVDGSKWRVSGPGQGREGVELALSPEALFDEAPFRGIWQQGAFQEGATYIGHTIEPIDMILPFNIVGDGGWDWEYIEARFFAAWDTDRQTEIVVTSGGSRRRLYVQKFENITTKSDRDPRLLQWSIMQVSARAAWPFWQGDTLISAASTNQSTADLTVTVANPTDRPMWLQWVLTAPGRWTIPDFDWGVGDHPNRKIVTPTLAAGQALTIETHPLREAYVAADGSNIAGRFGGVLFQHSVPPHTPPTDVPVKLEDSTGGGAVQCRMLQEWRRAWRGETNVGA
ncbi:phage tail protein [Corynebacterium callunae]|uniref:phage tail protein n=1 Tax=Corynebacterium callunae TaxID=1721 RepID=UPI003982A004